MPWSFYNSSGKLIDGVLDSSITAAKIADGAITNAELATTAITSQTAETTIAGDDVVLIYDTSASAFRKMTRTNFVAGLGGVSVSANNTWTGDQTFEGKITFEKKTFAHTPLTVGLILGG